MPHLSVAVVAVAVPAVPVLVPVPAVASSSSSVQGQHSAVGRLPVSWSFSKNDQKQTQRCNVCLSTYTYVVCVYSCSCVPLTTSRLSSLSVTSKHWWDKVRRRSSSSPSPEKIECRHVIHRCRQNCGFELAENFPRKGCLPPVKGAAPASPRCQRGRITSGTEPLNASVPANEHLHILQPIRNRTKEELLVCFFYLVSTVLIHTCMYFFTSSSYSTFLAYLLHVSLSFLCGFHRRVCVHV